MMPLCLRRFGLSRSWFLRIEDILEAIERILRYTAAMTEDEFIADDKTIDAVVRNMTVIGEAANFVPEEVQVAHAVIPWAKMRAFRNVVVHEYFGVSNAILWQTIQVNLPPLVAPLKKILESDG